MKTQQTTTAQPVDLSRLVQPSARDIAHIMTLVAYFADRNFPDTKEGEAARALVPYISEANKPNDERSGGGKGDS